MNKILLLALIVTCASYKRDLSIRVHKGVTDTQNKYPFVVQVRFKKSRVRSRCTGSAIASEWVVTAAHCVRSVPGFIRYGNISKGSSKEPYATILKTLKHPRFISIETSMENDMALIHTTPMELQRFGTLLAVDYRALTGLSVEFAGYGTTKMYSHENDSTTETLVPLHIGYGSIVPCEKDSYFRGALFCVHPKCSDMKQVTQRGDAGGPVFVDSMIAGVLAGGNDFPARSMFSAVSAHLTWIYKTMRMKSMNEEEH